MSSRLAAFVQTAGAPTWRLGASGVVSALEVQYGPDAVNAIEPLSLPGGCLGIGSNHQRSLPNLVGALALLAFSGLYLYRVVLPAHDRQSGPQITALLVLSVFLVLAVGLLALFLKQPGPDTVLLIGQHGAYAAWRSRLSIPRQAELAWADSELRFEFHTVTKFNADFHNVRVLCAHRTSPLPARLLFAARLDDAEQDQWLRFAAEVPAFMGAGQLNDRAHR